MSGVWTSRWSAVHIRVRLHVGFRKISEAEVLHSRSDSCWMSQTQPWQRSALRGQLSISEYLNAGHDVRDVGHQPTGYDGHRLTGCTCQAQCPSHIPASYQVTCLVPWLRIWYVTFVGLSDAVRGHFDVDGMPYSWSLGNLSNYRWGLFG